jgi:hypothetical protein
MDDKSDTNKRVLITDGRAEILENYNPKDTTHRTRKYRLEKSTQTTISELIKIAQFDELDKEKAFPRNDVIQLIATLAGQTGLLGPDNPTPYQTELRADLAWLFAKQYTDDIEDDQSDS